MGCSSCGGKKSAVPARWVVDLNGVQKADGTAAKFSDGSSKKIFTTPGEATSAIVKLGLLNKIRPRIATASE